MVDVDPVAEPTMASSVGVRKPDYGCLELYLDKVQQMLLGNCGLLL